MDATASFKKDTDFSNLCSFYVKIENDFPSKKNSVIKYTRLPEFEFNTIEKWPKNSLLEPKLRRIIAIEEPLENTTRSLKSQVAGITKMATTAYSKRKIVTIDEDEENTLHPKFSREVKNSNTKMINRTVASKDKKQSQQTSSRLTSSTTFSPEAKQSTKATPIRNIKRNVSIYNNRDKQTKENDAAYKGKETTKYSKNVNPPSKSVSCRKLLTTESIKEIQIIRKKMKEECKSSQFKKVSSKEKIHKTAPELGKLNNNLLRELSERKKKVNVIRVPLERNYDNYDITRQISNIESEIRSNMVDSTTGVDDLRVCHDMNIGTEPVDRMDKLTTTITNITESNCSTVDNKDTNTFDNLKIPNVTLITEKCETSKENLVSFCSQSLPNLIIPSLSVTKDKENTSNKKSFKKSTSYIISRATLTYTTKQEIDFRMVENNIDMNVTPNTANYPMSIMSVFKKELRDNSHEDIKKKNETTDKRVNKKVENVEPKMVSLEPNRSDSNKLVKPSEIITSINSDNRLSPNDFINEQFQRELNFIDSFFESLQYLENCSFSDKTLSQSEIKNFTDNKCDCKKLEYDSFFSKLDKVDDRETIASKSLCLLNLLIRDEQRRAKNLLFVLKMREDALKDFTKSQILWLENRKKQDNIDISTLKKKQRGALLKLQHECGEMQRMRKTLLTLSEKRKVGLMKTKRNIELKFRNHVDVEQIIMQKRKLKRNSSVDRNTAPLKCFDLSSSGCEESTTSRPKSVTPLHIQKPLIHHTQSAEKCIQTNDSVLYTTTAEENFVVVDGGYLNILFQHLNLPDIFSSTKQYEVNENALKSIVATTNDKVNVKDGDAIKCIMDHVKSHESDQSSSPSTARSLVEEFDQYYKGLNVEEQQGVRVHEVKDVGIDVEEWDDIKCDSDRESHSIDIDHESVEPCMVSVETQCVRGRDDSIMGRSVAGPLPVPAGEAATTEPTQNVSMWITQTRSTSSTSPDESSSIDLPDVYSSSASMATPAQYEAEELRKQQLAIEKEIKALEQQQCQLLVVREIPDKPPPPYTPPTVARAPKPRQFVLEPSNKEKLQRYVADGCDLFDTDPFDVFLKDYCDENMELERKEQGNKFWDTCHDLSKKRLDVDKSSDRMTADLKDVLTGVTPAVVSASGVGARRSDHIDDILFAEWRRCEPEWTSLHTDEIIVKNQIFESIFQKILTETVDEYKKSVIVKPDTLDDSNTVHY